MMMISKINITLKWRRDSKSLNEEILIVDNSTAVTINK